MDSWCEGLALLLVLGVDDLDRLQVRRDWAGLHDKYSLEEQDSAPGGSI